MPNATNTSAAPPGSTDWRAALDPGCALTAVLIAFVLFSSFSGTLVRIVRGGHPVVII